jgi:hypothetical protein
LVCSISFVRTARNLKTLQRLLSMDKPDVIIDILDDFSLLRCEPPIDHKDHSHILEIDALAIPEFLLRPIPPGSICHLGQS